MYIQLFQDRLCPENKFTHTFPLFLQVELSLEKFKYFVEHLLQTNLCERSAYHLMLKEGKAIQRKHT
jgi:hypothetical protein